MPSLGADMEAGRIVEWNVKPGDVVRRGDIVVLVETDKGIVEVEIFENGVLEKILVEPGAKVPCGTLLATLKEAGAPAISAAPSPPPAPPPPTPAVAAAPSPPAPAVATVPPPARGVRASPLARRLAARLGVDLAKVRGTGESNAITRTDVLHAAHGAGVAGAPPPTPAALPPPPPAAGARSAAMRRAIAAAMARSKREIPHYYLGTTIDLRPLTTWLAEENARRPVTARLLPAALFLRAVALAAREVPEMNGFWVDDRFQAADGVHLGVGIALRQEGLVAPAIHDVDRKKVDEVMRDMLDLVKRVRAGTVRSSELSDATLTVTNLGDQGVETVYGVIYPPQVALVGFGRIVERPWAVDGAVGVHPAVACTLAADHRASDGHRGGRFLAAVDRLLQHPEAL